MRTFFLLITIGVLSFSVPTISSVRKAFSVAHQSKEKTQEFQKLVDHSTDLTAGLKLAYSGAADVMMSNYSTSLSDKLALFKKGKSEIDLGVNKEPNSVEIRLIRLVIQTKVPSFLKYNAKIKTDQTFIVKNFSKANPALQKFILSTGKSTQCFTNEQLASMKK